MTVETATKISQLLATAPPGTDPKSEGDNHLRLIKSCLQAVFDDSGTTIKTTLPIESPGGAIINGSIKTAGAPQELGSVRVIVANASGTYTKPAGLKSLEVWVIGGGGGGGVAAASTSGQASAGGGGGAGGVGFKVFTAAAIAATVGYTVGAGGLGGTGVTQNGGPGGTTTFGAVSGSGGGGGGWMASTTVLGNVCGGGAGGLAAGGDLILSGGDGYMGLANPHNRPGTSIQGQGGSNMFAAAKVPALTTGVSAGAAGGFPGGGGQGAAVSNVAGAVTNGGAGATGGIIFKEHF